MDPTQPLDRNVSCHSCGYNLRGLTLEKLCPECGSAISRSVLGDQLCYSDPDWIDKLRRGAVLLRWSIVIRLLLWIGGTALGFLAAGMGTPASTLQQVGLIPMGLAASVLGVIAAFLITTQEPRVSYTEDSLNLRWVVRYCTLAGFFGGVVGWGSSFNPSASPFTWGLFVVSTILQLASVVGFFGQFVYFRRFARRIPDSRLARSTGTVMWGVVISLGISIVAGAAVGLSVYAGTGGGTFSLGAGVGSAFICVAGIGLLVFLCWAYRLLLRYVAAFTIAAREARR
ncbi:MAG: hypothetical protein GY842_20900 [bacterium]|nr:hypothetical protein [bacterium]